MGGCARRFISIVATCFEAVWRSDILLGGENRRASKRWLCRSEIQTPHGKRRPGRRPCLPFSRREQLLRRSRQRARKQRRALQDGQWEAVVAIRQRSDVWLRRRCQGGIGQVEHAARGVRGETFHCFAQRREALRGRRRNLYGRRWRRRLDEG